MFEAQIDKSSELTGIELMRLQTLAKYRIWNTLPDASLDRLTKMAARLLHAPIALISLVGEESQWFKSRVGLDVCETSRDVSFCSHAIKEDRVMVVPDAISDARFANNALVTGPPFIRFYAGAPLKVDEGIRLGSFCVIDTVPRLQGLNAQELALLEDLAAIAVSNFDHYLNSNLFETNPAPVFVVDSATLRLLNCNVATSTLLGYSSDELLKMKLSDLSLQGGKHDKYVHNATDSGLPSAHLEPGTYRTRTGRNVLALATTRKMDYLGRDCILTILTDVTEITQTQERLSKALTAAEAGVKAKTEFFATMSHELRTPLNHIVGMADLLLATEMTAEQRDWSEVIVSAGQKLNQLVDDILNYASARKPNPIEETRFHPQMLVAAASRRWRPACIAKSVILRSHFVPHVPKLVSGPASIVSEVLDRLLDNALKFTKSGTIDLSVQLAPMTPDGRLRLRFFVRDTGVGLQPELSSQLFQPFSQADSSSSRSYEGAGLGLAICRRLLERFDGEIGFSGELGVGCTFWFDIPVLPAESDGV